jgi:hypothetical protein
MGSIRLHRAYSVTTSVENDQDGTFAVFDTVRIGSSPDKRIARFKGTEQDCLVYGEKLAAYWLRAVENTPSIDE